MLESMSQASDGLYRTSLKMLIAYKYSQWKLWVYLYGLFYIFSMCLVIFQLIIIQNSEVVNWLITICIVLCIIFEGIKLNGVFCTAKRHNSISKHR